MGDSAASGFGRSEGASPPGFTMPVSMWMTTSGMPAASAASLDGVAAPTARPKVADAAAASASGAAGALRTPPAVARPSAQPWSAAKSASDGTSASALASTYSPPP